MNRDFLPTVHGFAWMLSKYVQGTFRVHPDQALYFYVSIQTDYVLEDADYFLDALFYRSTEMLKRFYPTIQKLCAGRMLDYNDFCLSSFNCDHDIGNVKMSQRDDEKLFQLFEDFMVNIEDECISEDCYESISSLHLRNELFQACENKNMTLDVWAEDSCRVCISLELPLQKIPNTEPMLLDCFQESLCFSKLAPGYILC